MFNAITEHASRHFNVCLLYFALCIEQYPKCARYGIEIAILLTCTENEKSRDFDKNKM